MNLTYLPTGEVDQAVIGQGESARVTSFFYDELHRLERLTDPEDLSISYTYDSTNRIETMQLQDQSEVSLGYDGMGFVTLLSPPGRPAHLLTWTKTNQLESYSMPDVGTGPVVEIWSYDLGQRLVQLSRADGRDIHFNYLPNLNRYENITTPRGNLAFIYQPDGKVATIRTFDNEELSYQYDGPLLASSTWSAPSVAALKGPLTRACVSVNQRSTEQIRSATASTKTLCRSGRERSQSCERAQLADSIRSPSTRSRRSGAITSLERRTRCGPAMTEPFSTKRASTSATRTVLRNRRFAAMGLALSVSRICST